MDKINSRREKLGRGKPKGTEGDLRQEEEMQLHLVTTPGLLLGHQSSYIVPEMNRQSSSSNEAWWLD